MLGKTSHFIKIPYYGGNRCIVIHMNQNNGLYDIYHGTNSRDTYPLEADLRNLLLNEYKGRQVTVELATDIIETVIEYFRTIETYEKSI